MPFWNDLPKNPGVPLEPSRTSAMELLYENS